MENDFNDIDLIDKYLSGDLNQQEQGEFDARDRHDPHFRDEVEIYRQIYKGLQQTADDDALKETLDHYYDKYGSNRILSIHNARTWVITGLAASLLIAAGVLLWPKSTDITPIAKNHNRLPQHSKKDTGNVSDQSVARNTRLTKPGLTDTEKG